MSKLLAPLVFVVVALTILGFAVPALINAPDTLSVIAGFLAAFCAAGFIVLAVQDIVSTIRADLNKQPKE